MHCLPLDTSHTPHAYTFPARSLQYQDSQSTGSASVFAFTVNYKGTPLYPLPGVPIDCTHSDVDQIQVCEGIYQSRSKRCGYSPEAG